MSELKNILRSLIKHAEECDAEQSSLQIDMGNWQGQFRVVRKRDTPQSSNQSPALS